MSKNRRYTSYWQLRPDLSDESLIRTFGRISMNYDLATGTWGS